MMNLSYQELNEKVESIQLRREEIAEAIQLRREEICNIYTSQFRKIGGTIFYQFSIDLHKEEEFLLSELKAIKIEINKRNRHERSALENQ